MTLKAGGPSAPFVVGCDCPAAPLVRGEADPPIEGLRSGEGAPMPRTLALLPGRRPRRLLGSFTRLAPLDGAGAMIFRPDRILRRGPVRFGHHPGGDALRSTVNYLGRIRRGHVWLVLRRGAREELPGGHQGRRGEVDAREGVYLAPSTYEAGFMSMSHTDEDIEWTIEVADEVLS